MSGNPRPKCTCPCEDCKTTQHCKNLLGGCTRKTNRRTATERAAGIDQDVIDRRRNNQSTIRKRAYREKVLETRPAAVPFFVDAERNGKSISLTALDEDEGLRMGKHLERQGWNVTAIHDGSAYPDL